MPEGRKVVETKLSGDEAYKKCFKRASQRGLNIKANIPGERLEIVKVKRTGAWWAAVIGGMCLYVVPGVLVLYFWKPVESCHLFDENETGATVVGQVKGEAGQQFFNDVAGLLN